MYNEDDFDIMVESLLADAKKTFKHCVNCGCGNIQIYFDYQMPIDEWIEHPSYLCRKCDYLE